MAPPVYLLLPAWGAHVRRAVDICLASLMAPQNLPALRGSVTLLVYTKAEDWENFRRRPMVEAVAAHAKIKPIFFEASPYQPESKHVTMSRGHELMLLEAEKARALAVPLFADTVLANGALPSLLAMTKPGRRMVMVMGLRIAEEMARPVFGFGRGPVSVSPRALATATVNLMHSQIRCWSAESPAYGEDILGSPWWRAADDGIICHSIYWEPTLIDFSQAWDHDVSPLREWTIDGHYPWWNLTRPEHYHVVTDSDEFLHVTTAPEAEYHFDATPMKGGVIDEFHRARAHPTTDPLRQRLSAFRFYIHGSDIDDTWDRAETKADAVVQASHVEPRERWRLTSDFVGTWFAGAGRDRNIVRVRGQVFSVPKSLGPLKFDRGEHLAPGVQMHESIEDALRACL